MRKIFVFISICMIVFASSEFLKDNSNDDKIAEFKSKLEGYKRQDLIKLALAGDDYWRSGLPSHLLILRGLREFINKLSDEEIKNVISKQLVDYNGLTFEVMLRAASIPEFSNVNAFLKSLDKEKLEKVAYFCEAYERDLKHQYDLDGGLNDYIWRIERSEVQDIILDYIQKYPKLSSDNLIQLCLADEYVTLPKLYEIEGLERDDLASIAITLETYERKKQNKTLIGGLHDYAYSLTSKQLVEIILNFRLNNPELSFKSKLVQIIRKEFLDLKKDSPIVGFAGAIMRNYFLPELRNMASYLSNLKAIQEGRLFPGSTIESYLPLMSKQDLKDFIINNLENFPDLDDVSKLEQESGVSIGGVYNTLITFNEEDLRYICAKVLNHDSANNGIKYTDDIPTYLSKLNKESLIELFEKISETSPEICEVQKLQKIVSPSSFLLK